MSVGHSPASVALLGAFILRRHEEMNDEWRRYANGPRPMDKFARYSFQAVGKMGIKMPKFSGLLYLHPTIYEFTLPHSGCC